MLFRSVLLDAKIRLDNLDSTNELEADLHSC